MPVFPPIDTLERVTISQAALLSLVLFAFIAVATILDRK
jgi:hypothetical protein